MVSIGIRRIGCVGLVVALAATAACQHKSSSSSAGSTAGGGSATANAAAATTAAGATDASGGKDSSDGSAANGGLSGMDARYCAKLKVADAQVLTTAKLAAAQTGGPQSCAFVLPGEKINGDNLTVTAFPLDADQHFYKDSVDQLLGTAAATLPNVGDEAQWGQPVGAYTAPTVVARKGSLTCVVQLPADLSTITIEKSGGPPLYNVSTAAAKTFAAKIGVLCNDVFSAGG